MNKHEFLNISIADLLESGKTNNETYKEQQPYPHICLDNLFDESFIKKVLEEFPALGGEQDIKFNNPNELKLASQGEYRFGENTKKFMHFLNSQPFLDFLTNLTGIKGLVPDPYFWGGGLHEIKPGGFLKIHADFNKHPVLNLDRRLNLIIYLNKNWEEAYGGHFELWDKEMSHCVKKFLPLFNRMVVFSTTDFSYHGHPQPLSCPEDRSRKSLAIYYYTSGRPANEVTGHQRITTNFRSRKGQEPLKMQFYNRMVNILVDLMPPIILKLYKKTKNS
jgi:hypothetical protein